MNPYGSDPRFALWPQPANASGNRLRKILGLRVSTYVALERVNLCAGRWSLSAARETADVIRRRACDGVVVALGRKVATGFRLKVKDPMFAVYVQDVFPTAPFGELSVGTCTIVLLPHPSGLSHKWNAPDSRRRARELLREHAPHVPWGEIG